MHKPFEYGRNYGEFITKTAAIIFTGYYTDLLPNAIATIASFCFGQIIWPYYVRNEAYEPVSTDLIVGADWANWFHMILWFLSVQILISYVGYLYFDSEEPRIANEKLLHNLDEGVFITDANDGSVLFLNSAAKHVNHKLKSECSMAV